ncbi:MAG: hypothetical protein RMK29_15755, partial [Myxococcales bacterium]|nr:hypothetical protein [Myxococcales bacterium]
MVGRGRIPGRKGLPGALDGALWRAGLGSGGLVGGGLALGAQGLGLRERTMGQGLQGLGQLVGSGRQWLPRRGPQ